MAYEIPGFLFTLPAGADLSAKQFYFVSIAADGQVDPTGAGLMADGVLQSDPDTIGSAAKLQLGGISKVVSGTAITVGMNISSDASGKAVESASGDYILGVALSASGADGQIISVLLNNHGRLP